MGPEAHPVTAAPDKLAVTVVTPVGSLLAHDADEVVAPGVAGELGVLPGHIPFLTVLKPGVLTVRAGKEKQILAVGRGFLQVGVSGVRVLVDQAAWPTDINVEEAKAEKAKIDEELKELANSPGADSGTVASLNARRDWAQARIDATAAK